jgi:hypothetical protein
MNTHGVYFNLYMAQGWTGDGFSKWFLDFCFRHAERSSIFLLLKKLILLGEKKNWGWHFRWRRRRKAPPGKIEMKKSVLELHFSLFRASLDLCHPPWTPLGQVIRLLPVSRETQIGTGTKHTWLEIPQCIVPHRLFWNILAHHYSNPDPSSDLTYHPDTQSIPQLHKPHNWGKTKRS